MGSFDFEKKVVNLTKDFYKIKVDKIDVTQILGKSPSLEVLPVFLRDKLKEFNLITITDFDNWIIDFFTIVQNMVHPEKQMTKEQVSTYRIQTNDIFEFLHTLCKGIEINCFFVTRQVPESPDRVRCMGQNPNIDFYVLLNMPKKNEYQVFVKNQDKFLFTLADFPHNFKEFVKHKCKTEKKLKSSP